MSNPLLTIGHSNHPIEFFTALLGTHRVDAVVDVRSYPKSEFAPQYNAYSLRTILEGQGIKYLYMGKELGGRPKGDGFYDEEGRVLYSRVAEASFFLEGLNRLERGISKFRIALLCSEENPSVCHRRLLISRILKQREWAILHIRGDGRAQSEEELSAEEVACKAESQLALFPEVNKAAQWKSILSVLPRKQRNSSSRS